MLRKWLKRISNKNFINQHASLRKLKNHLQDPNLWSINSVSLARGVSLGILVAFIPLPFQMIIAALLSMIFRANLPVAVALTWITNPITFIPINLLVYHVGSLILGTSNGATISTPVWDFSSLPAFWDSLISWISHLSYVYLIGLSIVAISAAVVSYFLVVILWRFNGWLRKPFLKKRNKS